MAACLGLVGHQSTYPCLWCVVNKSDLGQWRPAVLDAPGFAAPRLAADQAMRAHMFGGDGGGNCSCCGKTFQNLAAVHSVRRVKVSSQESEPSSLTWSL